jgi:uncharacterized SAM-binding protein YcdF (DUF218 family)
MQAGRILWRVILAAPRLILVKDYGFELQGVIHAGRAHLGGPGRVMCDTHVRFPPAASARVGECCASARMNQGVDFTAKLKSQSATTMFFIASKVFGFFALPSNDMLALGLIGLALTGTRFAPAGRGLMTVSVIMFAVFGLLPVGKLLIAPLEDRFPPWDAARGAPDGIVVLGGAIDPEFVPARPASELNEAAERITVIAELSRKYPSARILYSGGDRSLRAREGSEAHIAGALLETFGVPASRLILEDLSRNTAENAAFSRRLAQPKPGERWLLVTSAYHMPRSIGAFRKAGFLVEAYPVDYRTTGAADLLIPFDSMATGLRRTDIAAREWIGLLTYWLTGRISELFPAP